MANHYFNEKSVCYGISLLLIIILNPLGVGDIYLILGHSHFMMTALYQFKRKKITPLKLTVYLLVLFGMMALGHLFPRSYTVFAASFLVLHVYSGEIRHLNRAYSLPYFLMTINTISLLSTWLIEELWQVKFNLSLLMTVLNLSTLIACLSYFNIFSIRQIEPFFPTQLAIYFFFLATDFFGYRPYSVQSFGFITIAHYMTTYFNTTYLFQKKDLSQATLFLKESIVMNLIFLVGYVFVYFIIGTQNVLHHYIYNPISFYVWSVMHFLSTWNWSDYKDIFKIPEALSNNGCTRHQYIQN